MLEEGRRIEAHLRWLRAIPGLGRLFVVDGRSTDDTVARALTVPGVTVIKAARRGRGPQQDRGAAGSRADVLWFVHADCTPPRTAVATIRGALRDPQVVGGAFEARHVADGPMPAWVRWSLPLADLRSRLRASPWGDQALFVRRSAFDAVGGFGDLPLFEDLDLVRRLGRRGRIRIVPACVRVSGRRFAAAPWSTLVKLRVLPLLWHLGVPPRRLARWYGNPREPQP